MTTAVSPIRDVPYMGVIYVVAEAVKLGYGKEEGWANLGQGMPEIGPLPGAPDRVSDIHIDIEDQAYGPVEGLEELRDAVADLYNRWYRMDRDSHYTAENVAITAGGRLALTRAVWALNDIRLGYCTPEYTAYEDLVGGIPRIEPVHIPLPPEDHFLLDVDKFAKLADDENLGAFLVSNPCNPTGQIIRGARMERLMEIGRDRNMALIFDEFYSHFVWSAEQAASAAAHVNDVNEDPVLIVDGLTKCFRYPGWRIGWTVGPKDWVQKVTCSGSALDGGAPRWLQRAAVEILEPARAEQEINAMREAFLPKYELMRDRLEAMGIRLFEGNDGTFYCWASLEDLPEPLNDGMNFFREALKHKVMVVPGEFFDVNPGQRRDGESRLRQYARFSFGSPIDVVESGLDRLAEMIEKAS